jgi:hypothetical protein
MVPMPAGPALFVVARAGEQWRIGQFGGSAVIPPLRSRELDEELTRRLDAVPGAGWTRNVKFLEQMRQHLERRAGHDPRSGASGAVSGTPRPLAPSDRP